MPVFTQTVSGSNDREGTSAANSFDGFTMGNEAGSVKYAGVRFTTVTIPAGSTINSAAMSVNAQGVENGQPATIHTRVFCEAADDPGAWDTTTHRIDTATATTAFADWDPSAWGVGSTVTGPDFASAVQEVIDRGGWASGNAVAILVRDDGSSSNGLGYALDNSARIAIDYTEGAGGGGAVGPGAYLAYYQRIVAGVL